MAKTRKINPEQFLKDCSRLSSGLHYTLHILSMSLESSQRVIITPQRIFVWIFRLKASAALLQEALRVEQPPRKLSIEEKKRNAVSVECERMAKLPDLGHCPVVGKPCTQRL